MYLRRSSQLFPVLDHGIYLLGVIKQSSGIYDLATPRADTYCGRRNYEYGEKYKILIYAYVAGVILNAAKGEEKYHRPLWLKIQLNFLKAS